ncbi:MAG TPA: hypothetical protein VGN97_00030, partial [Mesorhizobium sp.]|nr:hypothetical protein [Mesorhizobium sp.]
MITAALRGALAALGVLWLTGAAAADPVVQGEEHCVVNVRTDDRLNMRERPSANAKIVARKRYGDCGM